MYPLALAAVMSVANPSSAFFSAALGSRSYGSACCALQVELAGDEAPGGFHRGFDQLRRVRQLIHQRPLEGLSDVTGFPVVIISRALEGRSAAASAESRPRRDEPDLDFGLPELHPSGGYA